MFLVSTRYSEQVVTEFLATGYGGLDSSAIAVLVKCQATGDTDLHTFTSSCTGDPAEVRDYVGAVLDGHSCGRPLRGALGSGLFGRLGRVRLAPRRAGK